MRRAAILYTRADAKYNRVLIGKYRDSLADAGYSSGLVITDRLSLNSVFDMVRGCSAVINRTRDHELAEYLESQGLFVSNPSSVCRIANDKLKTYEALHDSVPMLDTYPLEEGEPPIPCPFVAKPASGHGGAGVTLIKSADELALFRAAHPEKCVIQPLASELGRDLRVYVIGGEPIAAMLRESDTDFRSNFSLGGKAGMIPAGSLPEDVKSIVRRVTERLPLHYAGVDIIRDNGRAVLNEIEDPVGARMLYIYTDFDPARLHTEFITQIISKE